MQEEHIPVPPQENTTSEQHAVPTPPPRSPSRVMLFALLGISVVLAGGVYVFFKNRLIAPIPILTPTPSSSSPQEIFDTQLGGYTIRDGRAYYADSGVELIDVDIATFRALGDSYAKDKNKVWYEGDIELIGVDGATFQILVDKDEDSRIRYAKDKNRVWLLISFNGSSFTEINGADPTTFEDLGNWYSRDKRKIWYVDCVSDWGPCGYGIEELTGVDTSTFRALGGGYAKDKHSVWFLALSPEQLHAADAPTFLFLGNNYAKDKNNVYLDGDILKGVNPSDCTVETLEKCNPNP